MNRANPTVLFGFFVAIIAAMCGAALLKGGFYLGKHEGDTFHLMQIVLRMADGQWPHLDFMTPIGALAFAPIVLFVNLGFGIGMSMLLSQALVSVVLLPAVWWVAYSRMQGMLPYLFGLIIFVLVAALVHGEAQRSVSFSMHYNRWAWAAAFVAAAAAVLPSRTPARPVVDGVIIGLLMFALLMTKVTYFAAFAIPILAGLILHGMFRALFVAVLTGILAMAALSIFSGLDFWSAYLGDVLAVALSEIRPSPSEPFTAVVGAPAYIGASLVLIAGVILLRQARVSTGGVLLLLLTPAFFFVTFQNFANDPQWLMFLGVLLIAMQPEMEIRNGFGWDMRSAIKITAAMAFAMSAPSFFNLAYSPFRHFNIVEADYSRMLPRSEQHGDIFATNIRMARTDTEVPLNVEGTGLVAYTEIAKRDEPTVFKGETLPDCELMIGLPAWFDVIVADLEEAGLAEGKRLFAADLFSSHWLFGSLEPLKNGAPWYYGGLPGIESADYLLVPLCPVIPELRAQILESIETAGLEFNEIRRTSLYILLEPAGLP